MNLDNFSPRELLALKNRIKEELEGRGIVRTHNIVGDYTEWLVSEKMNLSLERPSQAGFDATGPNGSRYQIKGRQRSAQSYWQIEVPENSIEKFDYLVAIVYNHNFTVDMAFMTTNDLFIEYAHFSGNRYVISKSSNINEDDRVEHITERLVS